MPLDFGGGLFPSNVTETSGLNTPRDDQDVISIVHGYTDTPNWETLRTVTSGKTYYISTIIGFGGVTATYSIGSASTADASFVVVADTNTTVSFTTPLKYTSGTVVQVRVVNTADSNFTIIGWEE